MIIYFISQYTAKAKEKTKKQHVHFHPFKKKLIILTLQDLHSWFITDTNSARKCHFSNEIQYLNEY